MPFSSIKYQKGCNCLPGESNFILEPLGATYKEKKRWNLCGNLYCRRKGLFTNYTQTDESEMMIYWFANSNCKSLPHSLLHHFETVPNSKKMQTTTEMWLLKDFKMKIA